MTVEMTSPKKCCGARTNRWVIAAAIAILIVGAILSRVIEPGVRVEKVMLTANTPALRLSPATPGPHPIALLAHGATGSKENLFRFGPMHELGAAITIQQCRTRWRVRLLGNAQTVSVACGDEDTNEKTGVSEVPQ
jgi:hypothetical protein